MAGEVDKSKDSNVSESKKKKYDVNEYDVENSTWDKIAYNCKKYAIPVLGTVVLIGACFYLEPYVTGDWD